jgi:2-methylisocitrate lyase-like PEP mutase family enzyme
MSSQNALALHFKSLHTPGHPLILTNIWDAITARTISSLPSTRALATASYAIAAASSLADDDLDLDTNIRAVTAIARVASNHNLPLTVDLQDGYGENLDEAVTRVIAAGAVGCNLEDLSREKNTLYSVDEACARIRTTMQVATKLGVPDFVVNARTDALFAGERAGLEEAIARGKAYLAAGAFNVFIWGGPARKGWGREEVQRACSELGGRLNVILIRMDGEGKAVQGLSVRELGEIGVSRISVGPQLMRWGMAMVGQEASRILGGEMVS